MQIPQIRLQSTRAGLGLDIQKPVQEIEQPRAVLNLKQEPAILEISQPRGELTIDTTEARANYDRKDILQRIRENADYGYQKAMEAIAQASAEGDRLAAIENKGNPIADIAYEESGIYENSEIIAAGSTDGDGVDINYVAKPAEINVEPRGMSMDPEIKKPVHNYTPGKVVPYVSQWNRLQIDFVGLHVDKSV